MPSGSRPPVRFLAIDTHWSSARGGVSTFNRELCIALAGAGADVCCLVIEARTEDVEAARDAGVRLIGAGLRLGWDEGELMMLRPRLPEGWLPQVIIGHGRVTGRFAEAHREDRFGGAAYFHVVHTDPERMGGQRAETKWEHEVPLMARADRVLAVGPALWRRAESDLRPWAGASVPIQIDPGFDIVGEPAKCPPARGARKVLIAGRLEDHAIKGLDVAARAFAGAITMCAGSTRGVGLILRGVPPEKRDETEAQLQDWAGTELDIDLHRYSDKPLDMQQDLHRSVLVLMPSRAEGFGLVGQEAIVAGVPVLVSHRSGLGELLTDEAPDIARGMVLPVNRDGTDVRPWSEAVAAVLDDPGGAFARARQLRERMSRKRSWSGAAQRVLQAWAVTPARFGRKPAEILRRTVLLCADGAAGQDFLGRLLPVLRDMVDHVDPKEPGDGEPSAWGSDILLCALGQDNRGDEGAAGLAAALSEAHRLGHPVVVLRISQEAAAPPGLPDSHTIDATGDFLETLERLTEYLADLDDGRSPASTSEPGPAPVPAEPSSRQHGFQPVNDMPAIASAGFHDRADTVALVLGELAETRYRLIVLKGQDGVGKTAVVRAIRDGQEEAEKPLLRSLLYFSARGYRWISAPALLTDLAGLAAESDREPLLTEARTAPWEAVADKVLAKIGTSPIAVVIDDADRLFDHHGNWTDLDLRDLVTHVVSSDGHPVSVLMLVRDVPAALGTRSLKRQLLPVDLAKGLPFRPYAEQLLRKMDNERGTLGLASASTTQLERLHAGTKGLPRSMELVAGILTVNRSQTVDQVADLLGGADDRPRVLFTEIFGRLEPEECRVLQALAVFVRPVPADAVGFLLAEAHPTLRVTASLEYLRDARVVHSYGNRYYLPARQADLALSTLPAEKTAGSASSLTIEHLRQRAVAYLHEHRQVRADAIGDLWPQFGEIELLLRMQDWDHALAVMNELDDTYLSRWGQSHALASWREQLKDHLQRPESRGANLSYLRAAARQHNGATSGFEDLETARELARELGDRKNVIVVNVQMANLLADRGELTEAAEKYREAIEESQIYGQLGLEVKARTGLATCAAKHGDFTLAEEEMNEVARLNDVMGQGPEGDDRRVSQLVNQAWLRGQRGDHDAANGLLLKARVLAEKLCSDARSAWVLGGLAANALAMGDNDQAIRLGHHGARIAQRLDNDRLLREINVVRGLALLSAGELTAAAEVAELAVGHASRATAVSALNLTGMAAFRLRDQDDKAGVAFLGAARQLQARNRRKDDYRLLDAEGLALTGLALLDLATPDEAARTFDAARLLTRERGVLAHNEFLLGLFGDDADRTVLAPIKVAAGIGT